MFAKLRSLPSKNCVGNFRIAYCVASSSTSSSNDVRPKIPAADLAGELHFEKNASEIPGPALLKYLKLSSKVLSESAGDNGLRTKKTMDMLIARMSECNLDNLSGHIVIAEFEKSIGQIVIFYRKRGDIEFLQDSLRPLGVRAFEVLCSLDESSAVALLQPLVSLLHASDVGNFPPMAIHVRAHLPRLLKIVEAVPPKFSMFSSLTRLAICLSYITLEEIHRHDIPRCVVLCTAVHLIFCRIGSTVSSCRIRGSSNYVLDKALSTLFLLLTVIGVSDKGVLNGFEKFLCDIASTRTAARDWTAWSANVLYAFSHACVPAPRLASFIADLLDRSEPPSRQTETIIRNSSITLRLCWAFISQGLLPPARVLRDLHSLMSCFIVRSCPISKISWYVNLLPQILPFLKEPFPYRKDLHRVISSAIYKRCWLFTGNKLKAHFPDMLVNLVFPHEGAVLAAGVFDSSTGRLLRYPSYAPSPEVIDNGATAVMLGRRCVLVIDIERNSSSLLHPGNYLSGRHERQRWLLERKGWPVCVVRGADHSPEELLRIMQMKARLDRLRSLNGVD